MAQLGLVRSGGRIHAFETRDSAIEWMEDRILEGAGWTPQEEGPLLALDEIDVFRGLDAAMLADLGRAVEKRSLPAGGLVCSHGDTSDEMFLVRRGRVHALPSLEGGKRHHLATFCRGDFFGEIAFLDREPRSADAEAATPVDLYALSRSRFDEVVKGNPVLGSRNFEEIASAMSTRLRMTDTELRMLEQR